MSRTWGSWCRPAACSPVVRDHLCALPANRRRASAIIKSATAAATSAAELAPQAERIINFFVPRRLFS